ncbi:MAG: hypothetical protein ACFBZ9_11715 [Sphingomonadales bacterium]
MTWNPQGLLIKPNPAVWWMSTFAGPAFPIVVTPGHVRFFITGRDDTNISRIGPVDVDFTGAAPRIMAFGEPVVDIGPLGCFDHDGAAYPWITEVDGKLWLYYVGWLKGHSVAMHHGIGLAVSDGWDKPFEKKSRAPILPLTDAEPFGTGSCCVTYDGPGRWRMYYTAFRDWRMEDGKPKHYYCIRETTSTDGLSWDTNTKAAIDHRDAREYALGKPCLTRENGRYVMYFVARGERYRIWRATYERGRWIRDDAPVDIARADWDSDMQAYPMLFSHKGQDILLYNGNGYGRSGLGWALRADAQSERHAA